MATKHISITGTAKWARVYERNADTKFGKKTNIVVSLDDKAKAILKEVGYRGKVYDEDGTSWTKFNRDWEKQFPDKLTVLGPPVVTDAAGNPFEETIGNGSKVTVAIEAYPSKFGIGTRLNKVTVLEHIPFVPNEDTGSPPVD